MGPKKEPKVRESITKSYSIDSPINTGSWNCVVGIAIEKTSADSFVLKAFQDEAVNGRRQQVKLINYDAFVVKILNDFANGELPYKFAFLLNFSSVFQEAATYITNRLEIPVALLAKVIRGLLLYLKEESLERAERKLSGAVDPIIAMAERPSYAGGSVNSISKSRKEAPGTEKRRKLSDSDKLTVRPPSLTKPDTKLLKRGEELKEDQCIDDAPGDGFFHLYILLTGFYDPEFPLELIKAEVPLYILLSIDTSLAVVRKTEHLALIKTQRRNSEARTEEIQNFWERFLQILWDPKFSHYFNDTIFQVYVPRRLKCENFKEFVYKEISYLMYDVSDLRRQLGRYLRHMKLWDVGGEVNSGLFKRYEMRMRGLDIECATVSVILRHILDVVSEEEEDESSFESVDTISDVASSTPARSCTSQSIMCKRGSWPASPIWCQLFSNDNEISIFTKTKELDVRYSLDEECGFGSSKNLSEKDESIWSCHGSENGMFATRFKTINKPSSPLSVFVDYPLYLLLLTRVICLHENPSTSESLLVNTSSNVNPSIKNVNFQKIKNLNDEMRNPHFTVTHGSRSILNGTPYDIKETTRDFFSPSHFKLVTPEKLKASSAPEFRLNLKPYISRSGVSELTYPLEYLKNTKLTVFEDLRSFLGEEKFANVKGYDFLEKLNKTQLLTKETQYKNNYNCVDCSYAIITDALLVVFHNRKSSDGTHHETFNAVLKTEIGLRDFYDYILEDEADWLKERKQLRLPSLTLSTISEEDSLSIYTDSDFWLEKSIKYQEFFKIGSRRNITELTQEEINQEADFEFSSRQSLPGELGENYTFHGYNISKAAVQFSGLKTVYYGKNCSIVVDLLERLYGDQHLGVHVFQNGHCLHLYSYVCPRPHLNNPNIFHLTLRSGILVVFSKRIVEVLGKVKEVTKLKSRINKHKKSITVVSNPDLVKKGIQTRKTTENEEFDYEMKLSLPHGLTLTTVRKIVKPCYIKQLYLGTSRLFLPNGSLIKMKEDQIQILKSDATVITSTPQDISIPTLKNYQITTPDGITSIVQNKKVTFTKKLSLFRNTDLETSTTYFRRGDGACYMLKKDGTMCVRFTDGTKISSTPFIQDWSDNYSESTLEHSDFIFIQMEVTTEHPDYATVIYNTQTQTWKILLPSKTSITVKSGNYHVQLDEQTELRVNPMEVEMKRHHPEGVATMIADFSVFHLDTSKIYCRLRDSSGKTFVIEPNSNCYVLNEEMTEGKFLDEDTSEMSQSFMESDSNLSRGNKYLVVKRDGTGFEFLHREDVRNLLENPARGMVVFVPEIKDCDKRLFVLIFSAPPTPKGRRKWAVESILPDPKFVPGVVKTETTSTYGVPPSWMHPFPKRKRKLEIPSRLACRVFLEINKTDIKPASVPLNCTNCQVEDTYKEFPENKFQDTVKRLLDNDQSLLREMYIKAVRDAMKEAKPKPKGEPSEVLKQYLAQSEKEVALQKYYEKCIRYHNVPNYFDHPVGMSWLILNGIVDRLTYPESHKKKSVRSTHPAPRSFKSQSSFSNEEIEYDLVTGSDQSYSDLTCRTDISVKSAPTVLLKGNICTCKVKSAAVSVSAPIYKLKDNLSSEDTIEMPQIGFCTYEDDDLEILESEIEEFTFLTLSDLMTLGLI